MQMRSGRSAAWLSALLPIAVFGSIGWWGVAWGRAHLHALEASVVVGLTLFAAWRYGWQLLHYLRAWWYATWHFPRLRRLADEAAAARPWPKRVFVVVASYLEEPWVTVESMQALMSNIAQLPCATTVVVAVGSEQDEALVASVWQAHPARRRAELVLQRQSKGKRTALGHALRAIARRYQDEPDSVTVFMDGDSRLESGALLRSIPFFLAFRDLGALTTNETAYIPTGGAWYRDWFALKFGQRQVLFQSHALSHRVLTLTGRFSLFRTSIVVAEAFVSRIENDTIEHWLHGRFRFLMGDDKSSWYHVLAAGWKMLYLPDVNCCSLESRDTNFLRASLSLPYRWFGNTLRTNPRALALGPRRTGWFIWCVLLDQRLSMWTSLVGITGATLLAVTKSLLYLPVYIAWAFLVRSLQMAMIVAHGHRVSLRTVPIMLYTQWVGAFIKIRAWHHLADQSWSKNHQQQSARERTDPLRRLVPAGTMALSYLGFALAVLLAHSALRLPGAQLFAAEASTGLDARVVGVRPDDGLDDAAALQQLIDGAPAGETVLVRLPPGQLDFRRPLVIRRSDVALIGAGQERTRIVSHLQTDDGAVIRVEGKPGARLGRLTQALPADAVQLELAAPAALPPGSLLWLRQANDDAFFRRLGSEQWRREYPYLRQSLVRVVGVQGTRVQLDAPTGVLFEAGKAELAAVLPVRRVRLSDFGIEQRAAGRDIAAVKHRYENLAPETMVDAIALAWTQDAVVERVTVRAAGRHPVSFENSHGFLLRDCLLDGAWNKGEGGSGYLRIARSYRGTIDNCQVRNIRHIAVQWSSAFNRLRNIDSEVDLNFHGGFTHHNVAEDVRFELPSAHPWPPVFTTPKDARWAPPDGPGNVVRRSGGGG
jgi:glycosyltransferase Alg8